MNTGQCNTSLAVSFPDFSRTHYANLPMDGQTELT